jgi:hypothetical protein
MIRWRERNGVDHEFAEQIDRSFLPRPQGPQPAASISAADPVAALPAAFAAFRRVSRTVCVLHTHGDPEAFLDAAIWSAIRAGWREGFNAAIRIPAAGGLSAAEDLIRRADDYSRFVLAGGSIESIAELHSFIERVKAGQRSWKHFDFGVSLAGAGAVTTPEDVTGCLERLRARSCPVQSIEPELGDVPDEPRVTALAEAARMSNAIVMVPYLPGYSRALLGRVNVTLTVEPAGTPDETAASILRILIDQK